MPSVRTRIRIDAPAEKVWQVLADFGSYDEWNPVIRSPRGELRTGADLDFKLRLGKIDAPIAARLLCADGRELRWKGPRNPLQAPLARGEHYFRIEDVPGETESVDLVHGEDFGGPVFALPWRVLEPRLLASYEALNRALKRRAEAL